MSMSDQLKFENTIEASPNLIYRYFTNSSSLKEWLCDGATLHPVVDGRIYLFWNDGYYSAGEFLSLEPDASLSFTWRGKGDPGKSIVEVKFFQKGDATKVQLVHSELGEGSDWEPARLAIQKGWELGLENLVSILEVGKDLRLFRRPMLGITLSDFSPEIASRMGVPVKEGVRLDGALEGMGAHAAGLKKDDVLVRVDGKEVKGFIDLQGVLVQHHAGDTLEVEFYRGPEKHTVMMTLSGRPLPDLPANQDALAAAVRKQYDGSNKNLENVFSGVSETDANHKKSPEDWSAKETLSHLIQSERETAIYISDLLAGFERWADDFGGNLIAPLQAIIAVYPTVSDLFAELKRCQAETISLLHNIPDDFMIRKASYWRLADGLLSFYNHIDSHLPQIQTAIDSARSN